MDICATTLVNKPSDRTFKLFWFIASSSAIWISCSTLVWPRRSIDSMLSQCNGTLERNKCRHGLIDKIEICSKSTQAALNNAKRHRNRLEEKVTQGSKIKNECVVVVAVVLSIFLYWLSADGNCIQKKNNLGINLNIMALAIDSRLEPCNHVSFHRFVFSFSVFHRKKET